MLNKIKEILNKLFCITFEKEIEKSEKYKICENYCKEYYSYRFPDEYDYTNSDSDDDNAEPFISMYIYE